jgi:putative Ca2+/H+ antiporter (TMEM165/GDT1 family)
MQFDGNAALVISTFALVFAAEWGDKVSLLRQ